ncbi:MAG: AcrR family transcriptional regulator [Planctomycetota bacterium]|jgi:AcrR family transcriptional regulator
MPAIVSHNERRDQIAEVVKRIIAESGMDSVTVRNVAREAGFSSTIVGHYFRDKRDLLAYTYGTLRTHGIELVDKAFGDEMTVHECFESLLPTNPSNLSDWQVWFGFWGKAISDPDLAAERLAAIEATNELFQRILKRGIDRGELPKHLDVTVHAIRLQVFINGLASFVVTQPSAWPPEAQRTMLTAEIDMMRSIDKKPTAGAKKKAQSASSKKKTRRSSSA